MKHIISIGILALIVATSAALALAQPQQPPQNQERQEQPRPPRDGDDPLGDVLFPPELIMQNQRKLALTDAQKQFIRSEIQRTTTRFNELQWQLQDAMEALHETMKAPQINEQQALAQLAKVLDAEREIKTLHMGMNIRLKNNLTQDQQTKLQFIRNTMMGPRMDGPRPGGPNGPGRGAGPGRGPGGPGGPGGIGPGPRPGGPGGPGPGRPGGPPDF